MARIDPNASSSESSTVRVGAASAEVLIWVSASTQNANVASSSPMRTWPNGSRQNVRSTRGENCPLASCSVTTSNEKTTPAVVMVAPAIVASSVTAASGGIANRSSQGIIQRRSAAAASSSTTIAPISSTNGRNSRLSCSRLTSARRRSPRT
jgi:hypothetical protein